jgi:phosphoketolase
VTGRKRSAAALADDRARIAQGLDGPKIVDGKQVEGTFRAHQVPLHPALHAPHLQLLENWLRSYRPEELFDENGRLQPGIAALSPRGTRRMGMNPHSNGGMLLRDLRMPDFRAYAIEVGAPGTPGPGDTRVLGPFLRDLSTLNQEARNFRVFGPDETASNGLGALFEMTDRQWDADEGTGDDHLARTGRVLDSMLSEHQCQGWLEGYPADGADTASSIATRLHPPRRFDVQPARQVAQGHREHSVAAPDRLAQLSAGLARLAARITTGFRTRIQASSITW